MKWGDMFVQGCFISALVLVGIGLYSQLHAPSHTEKLQQRRKTALEKYKDQMEM
jgi:hypothetical protein